MVKVGIEFTNGKNYNRIIMKLLFFKMPDISDYSQYISLEQLSSDVTIVIVFKTLFRSDDILVDIYMNEISEDSKVISGRKLSPQSLVSLPKPDIGFTYWINCVDQDGINTSLNKYNAHKFYLQFTSYEGEDWII